MSFPAQRVALRSIPEGTELRIKVVPGASRTALRGVWNDALRLAVAAPPEHGKANREAAGFLADLFGVRPAAVRITSGRTRALKTVLLLNVSCEVARARLIRGWDQPSP
jgi:uncharacterized protein (TIGR00251 family)